MSKSRGTALVFCALGVLVAILITGCAVFEPLFGIKETGESDGTGGIVGTFVNLIIPGGGTLVAAGAGIYAELRRRKWKAAAVATFKAINALPIGDVGPVKEMMADAHEKAGVTATVEAALNQIEGPARTHAPEAIAPRA